MKPNCLATFKLHRALQYGTSYHEGVGQIVSNFDRNTVLRATITVQYCLRDARLYEDGEDKGTEPVKTKITTTRRHRLHTQTFLETVQIGHKL